MTTRSHPLLMEGQVAEQTSVSDVGFRTPTFEEQVESFREAHSDAVAPKTVGARSVRVCGGPPVVLNGRKCKQFALWVVRTRLQVRYGVSASKTAAEREIKRLLLADGTS